MNTFIKVSDMTLPQRVSVSNEYPDSKYIRITNSDFTTFVYDEHYKYLGKWSKKFE